MWMQFKSWFTGELVGTDFQGNCYYQTQTRKGFFGWLQNRLQRPKKRWVVYRMATDPSQIPPSWHSWLHYTTSYSPKIQDYSPKEYTKSTIRLTKNIQKPAFPAYEPWVPIKEKNEHTNN